MFYTVYKITNLVNNKIYIGVHKTSDLEDGYMGSGLLIRKSIDKYGLENFKKEYISIFDNAEAMFNMESELVNEEFIKREDTYNLKLGGFGGFDYLNNSNLFKNKTHSFEHMKMMSDIGKEARLMKNKWLFQNDIEWCLQRSIKISNSKKEYYNNDGVNPFQGKKHSEETKKKIGSKTSILQSGEGNSQFGTMWIHNLELKENKKIKKDEFSSWEQEGWIKGRKMKI